MLIFKTAKVSQTAFFKSTYKELGCVDQASGSLTGRRVGFSVLTSSRSTASAISSFTIATKSIAFIT
jgi:hypothetical protein